MLKLTPKQEQVMELIATGLTNKEVGYRLGISMTTVNEHIRSICKVNRLNGSHPKVVATTAYIQHRMDCELE